MKIKTLLITILLAVSFGVVLPRQAEASVTFSYFYDSLSPYGDWVDVDTYGYCWQPRGVDADWRPYTDGYWSYTDAGWTWVSYEDFGSITYHYGRWVRLEDIGWVWKPDYQWGPAWVSWRQSDDYIGWAPLPPDAVFDDEAGIGVWVDRDYDIGPSAYAFCEYRYFGAPVLRNRILPRHRNLLIINSTVNITNITVVNGPGGRLVFNGGLDYRRISERTENRIAMLQLMRQTDGNWAQHHRSELSRQVGNQLFINAPDVQAPQSRFAPPTVARAIHAPKIDKGWVGVADAAEKQRIQQRYQDQTKGLTRATAPATRVDAAQVQSLIQATHASQAQAQQAQEQQKAQLHQAVNQQEQAAELQRKAAEAQTHAIKEQAQQAQEAQKAQLHQAVKQQEQAAELQRKAAETQAHAAKQPGAVQLQQMQAAQQQEQAAAQQRKSAEAAQANAAQQQQEKAAEQQRKAAEAQARAAQQQAAQAQQQQEQAQRQVQRQTPPQAQTQTQPGQSQSHKGRPSPSPSPDDKR